jgi:hypothetical protein
MFGFGRKNALIDTCALEIANAIAQRFPPAMEASGAQKKVQEKLSKALDQARTRALAFQREQGLGVYGKARLFSTLKGELQKLGYSTVFVDSTISSLATYVGNQGRG